MVWKVCTSEAGVKSSLLPPFPSLIPFPATHTHKHTHTHICTHTHTHWERERENPTTWTNNCSANHWENRIISIFSHCSDCKIGKRSPKPVSTGKVIPGCSADSSSCLTFSRRTAHYGTTRNSSLHSTSATGGRQALCHSWMRRTPVCGTYAKKIYCRNANATGDPVTTYL